MALYSAARSLRGRGKGSASSDEQFPKRMSHTRCAFSSCFGSHSAATIFFPDLQATSTSPYSATTYCDFIRVFSLPFCRRETSKRVDMNEMSQLRERIEQLRRENATLRAANPNGGGVVPLPPLSPSVSAAEPLALDPLPPLTLSPSRSPTLTLSSSRSPTLTLDDHDTDVTCGNLSGGTFTVLVAMFLQLVIRLFCCEARQARWLSSALDCPAPHVCVDHFVHLWKSGTFLRCCVLAFCPLWCSVSCVSSRPRKLDSRVVVSCGLFADLLPMHDGDDLTLDPLEPLLPLEPIEIDLSLPLSKSAAAVAASNNFDSGINIQDALHLQLQQDPTQTQQPIQQHTHPQDLQQQRLASQKQRNLVLQQQQQNQTTQQGARIVGRIRAPPPPPPLQKFVPIPQKALPPPPPPLPLPSQSSRPMIIPPPTHKPTEQALSSVFTRVPTMIGPADARVRTRYAFNVMLLCLLLFIVRRCIVSLGSAIFAQFSFHGLLSLRTAGSCFIFESINRPTLCVGRTFFFSI